ncbi:MAG: hypothetical protein IPM08_00220 [Actinomycetales bacterium]|nr:hypothetical protein [Actinomycetales bacterium]
MATPVVEGAAEVVVGGADVVVGLADVVVDAEADVTVGTGAGLTGLLSRVCQ